MKQHIANFAQYLSDGYAIGQDIDLSEIDMWWYTSLIFVGMWWSWTALSMMKTLTDLSPRSIPNQVIREYTVPNRVDKNTLMICSSYSGNTEETVAAMKDALEKWAKMIALTSWWLLKKFAESEWHILAEMPSWIEPRAAMPYNFGVQLAVCEKLWLIPANVKQSIWKFSDRVGIHTDRVMAETSAIAKAVAHVFPFIYTTSHFSSVALRAQQQLQENSRMQCHSSVLPEHNHNELLGWQEQNEHVHVIRLDDDTIYERNHMRVMLTKKILSDRNVPQHSITLHGNSILEKICSWLYQIDWLSVFIAEERGMNPDWSELIEWFKGELKQIK